MNNIAFFINDISSSGGTENVTCLISNLLEKQNQYNITIITLNQAHGDVKFPLSSRIKIAKINEIPKYGMQRFPVTCYRLNRLLKEYSIDILIDVDGILDLYSIPATLFSPIKLISWEHFNFHQNPDVPYRKLSRQLAGIFADAIVTLTNEDKKYYQDGLNVHMAKIVAIPNPMQDSSSGLHDENSKTILSAGRLTYQKGFDILIDVAKKVLPLHPDWQWIVVGEGSDREKLIKKTTESGLSKQLHFLGRIENMDVYFQKAAFFVLTSRFEGLPMVLLEAKSYNLPIISFNCETGPSELVTNDVNGYLIPMFDIDQMSDKINYLIDNPNKCHQFSNKARENTEYYSADSVIAQWNELIQSVK